MLHNLHKKDKNIEKVEKVPIKNLPKWGQASSMA